MFYLDDLVFFGIVSDKNLDILKVAEMRYKLLVCAFILLIATPVLGQEFSPITVDTGKPTPSVVKSGEPFKITYRAEFFDTVLIYEDQMNFEGLTLVEEKEKPGSEISETVNVEVVGLKIGPKKRKYNDSLGFVNVQDFTYTFRIINVKKGVYKIPSFNFVWVEKRAGVTAEETKDKEKPREMPTKEVGIGYVSSVKPADKPVKPPPLDIRDEINFVSPIADGFVWRRWAYGVIGIASLLAMIIVFRFARYSRARQSREAERESGTETPENEVVVNMESILSPKQARKKFLRELNKLQGENVLDLMKKIRSLVRALLLAELRGTIRDSMSENEIYAKLRGLDNKHRKQIGRKYAVMLELARRLRGYQEDIDLGKYSSNAVDVNWREAVELSEAVSGLKLHKRFFSFMKHLANERR